MSRIARLDPSRRVRELVLARDRYRCCRCGAVYQWSGFSIHHRRLRSHPWPGLHHASNLILLCGSGDTGCHGWVHAHPSEARGKGWLVSGFDDHPEQAPVWVKGRGFVLLDDEGGWTRCADTSN